MGGEQVIFFGWSGVRCEVREKTVARARFLRPQWNRPIAMVFAQRSVILAGRPPRFYADRTALGLIRLLLRRDPPVNQGDLKHVGHVLCYDPLEFSA
jgi:hypothetical protein